MGGVTRTAVLVVPTDLRSSAPLVLCSTGMAERRKLRSQDRHRWSAARAPIVIYPDELPGLKGITDPDGDLPGWQVAGRGRRSRLAFYDTMPARRGAAARRRRPRLRDGSPNGSALTPAAAEPARDAIA